MTRSASLLRERTKLPSFPKSASASMLWSRSAIVKSRLWEERYKNTNKVSAFPQPSCPRWELRWTTSRTDWDHLPRNPKPISSVSKSCSLRTVLWEKRCATPNKTSDFLQDKWANSKMSSDSSAMKMKNSKNKFNKLFLKNQVNKKAELLFFHNKFKGSIQGCKKKILNSETLTKSWVKSTLWIRQSELFKKKSLDW